MYDPHTMPKIRPRLLSCLAPLVLSGCAGGGDEYPSLAIRDVERAQGQLEPVPVPQLDVPTFDFEALPGPGAAMSAARAGDAAFRAALPSARRTIAAGRSAGRDSDARAAASVALAVLESRHSDTVIALAQLDTLLAAAQIEARERTDIVSARGEAARLVEQQDAILASLRSQLR